MRAVISLRHGGGGDDGGFYFEDLVIDALSGLPEERAVEAMISALFARFDLESLAKIGDTIASYREWEAGGRAVEAVANDDDKGR